jgi:Uma2 family endonuclease
MSRIPQQMNAQEFYAWESRQANKHERWQGRVYELHPTIHGMAGASLARTRIVRNILTALTNQLTGTNCEAVCNDLLVHTPQGLDAYPDVVVFCGEPQFSDEQQRVLTNPRVIIEVLSPSTELRDRGFKFDQYRTIPSFVEYLLITQDCVAIEHFIRSQDDVWSERRYRDLNQVLKFGSIAAQLTLTDIYQQVTLLSDEEVLQRQLRIFPEVQE